ncbi:MAG: Hsp70 family protein [Candidatus Methanoperedens sp.]|nr:Hsp70 family protein [Candidatus Methanoperedens sp.]
MRLDKNILGIDFGTTNSKMAYILLDEPVMIENAEGKKITPSIVYFRNEEEVVVGEIAKRNLIVNPENTISSIKREMGTDFKKKIGRHKFPPEYIGAHIFKKLVDDAEKQLGKKFTEAVVSVPANYSDGQRQAIKDAAEIAGINIRRLINEPTAAALAYGIREDRDKRVLVYDFGGGTFDVSILSVSSGFFDVDSSVGEHKLGGDDIDARIVEHVSKKLYEQTGIDIKKDVALQATLREAAEEAKITLSSLECATINIPFVAANKPPFNMVLTRIELNRMITDLIERTEKPIEQALDDASLDKNEIDDVLLVGGTTLIPAVREFVTHYFGKEPLKGDPYEAVALGAAVASMEYGKEKSNKAKNIEISDVISSSLGVYTADGTISKILERNTKIPIARTRNYTNAGDFTDEVIIPVYQGEGETAEECEHLGDFWISVEPLPANQDRVDVTFEVGKEFGILHVTAVEKISGSQRTVKMEARSRLSKKEKSKWMKKMLNMESIEVNVENITTRDTLTLYLNPTRTILDIKKELKEIGLMADNEIIFYDDIELQDDDKVSKTKITRGCTLQIRRKDEQEE